MARLFLQEEHDDLARTFERGGDHSGFVLGGDESCFAGRKRSASGEDVTDALVDALGSKVREDLRTQSDAAAAAAAEISINRNPHQGLLRFWTSPEG